MFRLFFNNSHLQVVHETLGNSYTRNTRKSNMGCVQCGVCVGGGLGRYEISYVSRMSGVTHMG